MKSVQNSESSGTNEECAESRVPLKMKTYGGEAECATPHKKNRGQAPIDLPKTLPEEAPRQKLQLSTMPCSFSLLITLTSVAIAAWSVPGCHSAS